MRTYATATSGAAGGAPPIDREERMQHLNYLLNLGIALVRQRVAPEPLLSGGLIVGLQAVVDSVLCRPTDGAALLQQRPLVLQAATIVQEIVRPPLTPTPPKDAPPPPVNTAVLPALIESGAGPMLEAILRVYKAVPDPKNPKQVLLDQSMCNRVVAVLNDMVAAGYAPVLGRISLDPDDHHQHPAGAGDAAAGQHAPAPIAAPAAGGAGPSGLAPRPPPPRAGGTPTPPVAAKPAAPAPPPAATPPPPAPPAAAAYAAGHEPLDAPQMVAALRAGGRVFEVWQEGKPRRARLAIDSAGFIVAAYEDGAGGPPERVPLVEVRVVEEGLHGGFKKAFFGRNPRPTHAVCLAQAAHHGGGLLLTVEAASEIQRHVLAQALAMAANATLKVTS
jgi:hypothetical protein